MNFKTKSRSLFYTASAGLLGCISQLHGQLEESLDTAISLNLIGSYQSGVFDEGAAEISSFDPRSKRLFLTNANSATMDILNLSDPTNPELIDSINVNALLGSDDVVLEPNSLDVGYGLVAIAIAREDLSGNPLPGLVGFFDTQGNLLTSVEAGFLPDMLTFSKFDRHLLVANEGEPNDAYDFDPEGSVSIINMRRLALSVWLERFPFLRRFFSVAGPVVRTADFNDFDDQIDELRSEGVRIFGPNASVSQDLEPEFITVAPNGRKAYVSLQENNALAVVDIRSAKIEAIFPLGHKDFAETGLDASDRDDAINIQPWPVLGMYQPDAIASYRSGRSTFIVTANEGDARDYDGFSEEFRLEDLNLDQTAFPDAADLQERAALGRLRVTNANGDTDGDGDIDEINAFGSRSFSIWKVNRFSDDFELVYDSGSEFEEILAELLPDDFNSTNDENGSFDNRSDDKGPEPEGVTIGKIRGRSYAFIGLERVGGIMVYDVTNPEQSQFVQYVNARDFSGDAEEGTAGDLGPEGIEFIPAYQSPNRKPLLTVANEVSGSVSIYQID